MNHDDVDGYLELAAAGIWVDLDVVREAFLDRHGKPISRRRALELARNEGWRTALGSYPREYAFADVQATYRRRKAMTS